MANTIISETITETVGWQQREDEFNPEEKGSNVINVAWPERMVSSTLGALIFNSGLRNLTSNPVKGITKTILGGFLLYRGLSGNCPVYSSLGKTRNVKHTSSINIRTTLKVNRPRYQVYAFWRNLENLPRFMKHLASVKEIDSIHSHWEAIIPGNLGRLKWNAIVVKEEPGSLLGWQSVPDSSVNNAGKVEFRDLEEGGTELTVVITYRAPAGDLGAGIAKLFNPIFEKIIRNDIASFKDYIEGEAYKEGIPTSHEFTL